MSWLGLVSPPLLGIQRISRWLSRKQDAAAGTVASVGASVTQSVRVARALYMATMIALQLLGAALLLLVLRFYFARPFNFRGNIT